MLANGVSKCSTSPSPLSGQFFFDERDDLRTVAWRRDARKDGIFARRPPPFVGGKMKQDARALAIIFLHVCSTIFINCRGLHYRSIGLLAVCGSAGEKNKFYFLLLFIVWRSSSFVFILYFARKKLLRHAQEMFRRVLQMGR